MKKYYCFLIIAIFLLQIRPIQSTTKPATVSKDINPFAGIYTFNSSAIQVEKNISITTSLQFDNINKTNSFYNQSMIEFLISTQVFIVEPGLSQEKVIQTPLIINVNSTDYFYDNYTPAFEVNNSLVTNSFMFTPIDLPSGNY